MRADDGIGVHWIFRESIGQHLLGLNGNVRHWMPKGCMERHGTGWDVQAMNNIG